MNKLNKNRVVFVAIIIATIIISISSNIVGYFACKNQMQSYYDYLDFEYYAIIEELNDLSYDVYALSEENEELKDKVEHLESENESIKKELDK